MTPKEVLAMTEDSLVSLQVTIRDEARLIAGYEQSLAELAPGDSRHFAVEALLKRERQRLQESQASLEGLVKVRTAAIEKLEKAGQS